jgi:hypothetical protein
VRVFVSSLIVGLEAERAAAKSAITTMRHEPVMAEDFGAQPNSPQVACLQGLRSSEVVVLILGERYHWQIGTGSAENQQIVKEFQTDPTEGPLR